MKKSLIVAGIILIAAAGLWKVAVAPRFDVRLPDDWSWSASTLGTNISADQATGQFPASKKFPDDDPITSGERAFTISHENAPVGAVIINDHLIAKDPNTGATRFESTKPIPADPNTGLNTAADFSDSYSVFPRNLQKSVYKVRVLGFPGLPLSFQGESKIEGLTVYEYAFTGEANIRSDFPNVPLKDGQDIKCVAIDLRFWVEPVTGEMINYKLSCSGNAVYDTTTNNIVNYLTRFSVGVKSSSIISLANQVSGQRTTYLLLTSYLPLLLVGAGVVLLGVGLFGLRANRAN